ncbi:unnamed protein product [Mytilus edulis]|uniref:Uncharacterized protein n=1 Tax=Mytilus edulis TaxID=6550 RepID=A0A8S3QFV5_MYTED|nr:unnamed protein product [Mytilus edulis]
MSYQRLPYQNDLWSHRYPKLASIMSDNKPGEPEDLVKPALGYLSGIPPTHGACRLKSLAKQPVSIYLPDGSVPNFINNVSQTGCWFSFDKCPNRPAYEKAKRPISMPYYRDMNAEMKDNSGTDETICLNKVSEMVSKCGNGSSFAVIFGPTGAMTLGGDGCYFATYGCPRVKSMASGFIRDAWAEQHVNGAHEESACLSRALPQWRYCGSDPAFPLASIYKPTGHIKVAGAGCWIKAQKCPADNSLKHMFYDSFGATYLLTDDDIESCFSRAEYFWRKCGSHSEYKVTAYFRPAGKSQSFP